jgi:hypothetical protein
VVEVASLAGGDNDVEAVDIGAVAQIAVGDDVADVDVGWGYELERAEPDVAEPLRVVVVP